MKGKGILGASLKRNARGGAVSRCDLDRAGRGRGEGSGHALGLDWLIAETCVISEFCA
jgi:hypothetical protein